MTNATYVVYQAENTLNGSLYIGITRQDLRKRAQNHKHTAFGKFPNGEWRVNGNFQKAIRKYGISAFVFSAVEEGLTVDDAKKREIELIAELKPVYNSTLGGDGWLGG